MTATHPTAAAGFGRAADAYERGRPGYPPDALAHLAAELGLRDGVTVLDLAAGTGKLTRMLAATDAAVIAVEPVAAMRRVLAAAVPGVQVLDGTAEAIPVADGTLDAVTVDRALVEIGRALRPGGGLALVWNTFDSSVDWGAALQALVHVYRRGEPQYGRGTSWREAFAASPLYAPLSERVFGLVHELDTAGLLARIGSTSYIATLPDADRAQLFAEVRALVAELPQPLRLPYRTDTYVTRRI